MRSSLAPAVKLGIFTAATLALTGMLAATIANTNLGATVTYTARFTDVTGLNPGDDVRISGVRMGQVSSIEVVDRKYAEIRFDLAADRRLPAATTATIKYRNLIGQRYVALGTDVGDPNQILAPGSMIPLERTQPALNLTALFNGFKPLFQALSPDEVNKLSYEIIQVLQGEGGTVNSLLAHIASVTSTIASRDKVIGEVIDNLNTVLGTVNARGSELSDLLLRLRQLATGLAEERKPIGEAIAALGGLTNATAGLLGDTRQPLKENIASLGTVSKLLNESPTPFDEFMKSLPNNLQAFTRTASYGGWFNYYMCRMSVNVRVGTASVSLPLVPFPASQMPERCGP